MTKRYFDDFAFGDKLSAGGYRVTAEEIVAFAAQYDPRPYHLDEAAGRESLFGGLVASGIHTLAIWNALRCQAEEGLAQLAGLGLDHINYPSPVRPGDDLRTEGECVALTPSTSKADRGIMEFDYRAFNQRDEIVMAVTVKLLVRRKAET